VLWKLLILSLAGAAGTISRYGLSLLVETLAAERLPRFPWGTLAVNALGCLLVGAAFEISRERVVLSPDTRLLIFTGFFGAFTTFATYVFESSRLAAESAWLPFALNIALQNVLGFAAFAAGVAAVRAA
jgi:CrcB protein